jgi:hypothetical protein
VNRLKEGSNSGPGSRAQREGHSHTDG